MSHIIIPGQPERQNELGPDLLLVLLESLLAAQAQGVPQLVEQEKPKRRIGFRVPSLIVEEEDVKLAV